MHHYLTIAQDHPCFPGHFPGQPILPGVLLLERVLSVVQQRGQSFNSYKIQNVKFLSAVTPGEQLQIDLVNTDEQGTNFKVFTMHSDGSNQRLACSGQLRWSLS